MNDLIEALTIFRNYTEWAIPDVACEGGKLFVFGVHVEDVVPHELLRLGALGFAWDPVEEVFSTSRFGDNE